MLDLNDMETTGEVIDITPRWADLAGVMVDRLLDNNDDNDVWKDSVQQACIIADEFIRLVKEGKITQEDTTINLSKVKMEK